MITSVSNFNQKLGIANNTFSSCHVVVSYGLIYNLLFDNAFFLSIPELVVSLSPPHHNQFSVSCHQFRSLLCKLYDWKAGMITLWSHGQSILIFWEDKVCNGEAISKSRIGGDQFTLTLSGTHERYGNSLYCSEIGQINISRVPMGRMREGGEGGEMWT